MNQSPRTGSRWSSRLGETLARFLGGVLGGLLTFLEIIGLRAPRAVVSHQAQMARFRRNYAAFRRLLSANDNFLRGMVELDRKIISEEAANAAYARETTARMVSSIHQMIASLNEIGADRHTALWGPFETVKAALAAVTGDAASDPALGVVASAKTAPASTGAGERAKSPLVLDLAVIDRQATDSVGGKMANLGEARNRLGLPTPDGFALSVSAYRLLLRERGLEQMSQPAEPPALFGQDLQDAGAQLADSLRQAEVPAEIEREILAAYDRLSLRQGGPCRMAVRSSALGEDTSFSFAGQYETVLDVDRDGLVAAWSKIVASLYSPAAISYRNLHGLYDPLIAMAVGFTALVPASASGVAFSRDPTRPDSDRVIVQLVSGLGVHLVDGSTNPETIEVTLGAGEPKRHSPSQNLLGDAEATQLARWARQLEAHFGRPQDIEWAVDNERRLYVLQSRPLRLADRAAETHVPLAGARPLVSSGEIVCPGIATGIAVHLDENADFSDFPERGVLVAKRSSPRFVALMGKAAGIVTDAGSTTGHMASLAREFRIPTILGTGDGTKQIPNGEVVTVDAFGGFVYAGAVDAQAAARASGQREVNASSIPETRRLLSQAALHIVPLHLTDPRAPEFRAERCRTLHDMARFVHEHSYEEMFRLGESLGDFRSAAYFLDVFLPVDLYIIDLGGGVAGAARGNRIRAAQISSVPLAALVKGMLHPKIPRWGARPIDLGGFLSIIMRHALTSPEQERSFRDPCYALASDRYVNCTARVGYHFSIVDAYCGETANKNYVHLLFRGGAADVVRRSRRARAIAGILKEWGFAVETLADSTQGRITKMPRETAARVIELVGRLLQFMRQMDVAMTSENAVLEVQRAFLREDYALEGAAGTERPPIEHPR